MDTPELLHYKDFLWKYFSLHADQRLKTFHFFIVVSAILVGAYVNMFDDNNDTLLIAILPLMISFISFIFWQLDIRTRNMIKNVEISIKKIDEQILRDEENDSQYLNIFGYDDTRQSNRKDLSYSRCFHLIFLVIGLFGVFGGVFHFIKIYINSLVKLELFF